MNINSDFSLKNVKMPVKIEQPKIKEGYFEEANSGILLPDIRSNQILLPDNKIYVPSSVNPSFNKKNITIEVPDNYQKVDTKNEKPMTVSARNTFKRAQVAQYQNTQTGNNIIRVTKNVFTEEGVLNSAEVMEIDTKNPRKAVRYIKDYEHNSETEIKVTMPFKPRLTKNESMTTIYRDKNGGIIKTEEYTKSAVAGIYDITEIDAAGNKTIISKTTKDENGNILIEKNLTSLDGTKTQYRFESDKDGFHKKLFTQITDNNGNVLSTIDRTYDKENENITYSSVNGHKFKAEKKDGAVEITNYFTGEKTYMKSEDMLATDDAKYFVKMLGGKNRHFSDENVVDKLFDTLPADTLLTMHNNIQEVIPLEDDLDSAFLNVFDYLMCKTDNFVVAHELGHSMDALRVSPEANLLQMDIKKSNPIADKSQFRKAYAEEKAAFIKEFPDFREKFINYFLAGTDSKPDRGKKETVAESNAINGLKPEPPESLAMRTTLLQRYFPRSIAELTKLMNPIALSEEVSQTPQQ